MDTKALSGLAVILGGAYLAKKTLLDETSTQTVGVVGPSAELTATEIQRLIAKYPQLKGATGPQGPQGPQGLQGPAGAAGSAGTASTVVSFGGSLIYNSTGELGTTENWTGANYAHDATANKHTLSTSASAFNSTRIRIRRDRLYKVEALAKISGGTSGYGRITIQQFNKDNNTSGSSLYFAATTTATAFTKETWFFGGTGAGSTKFAETVDNARVQITASNGATFTVADLCVRQVDLGEPVPNNLPFLPTGQMVYDVTTGEVGRFNGTTVDYFAMQP